MDGKNKGKESIRERRNIRERRERGGGREESMNGRNRLTEVVRGKKGDR